MRNTLFTALEHEAAPVVVAPVAAEVPYVEPVISDEELEQQETALESFAVKCNELNQTLALEAELIALRSSVQVASLEGLDETTAGVFNISLRALQKQAGIKPRHNGVMPARSVAMEAALIGSASPSERVETALANIKDTIKKIWKAIADGIRRLVKMAEAIWVRIIDRASNLKSKVDDLKKEVQQARLSSNIKNHPPFVDEQLWHKLAIGTTIPKNIGDVTRSYSEFIKNLEHHQFAFDLNDIQHRMQAAGSDPSKNVIDDFKLPDMDVPGTKTVTPPTAPHNDAAIHYVESEVYFGNRYIGCWLPNKGLVGVDAIDALKATSATVGIKTVHATSGNDFHIPVASLEDCEEILNAVGEWCDQMTQSARDKQFIGFLRTTDAFFRKVEEDGWIQEVDSKATPHLIADTRHLGNLLQGVMSAHKAVNKASYSNGINISTVLCQYAEKSIATHKA